MSDKSKIEWCDATWNPITGCTKVSRGCENCYAARQAATILAGNARYAGLATMHDGTPQWTGEVRLHPDLLSQPLYWKKPRRIFLCSQADIFHEAVPRESIASVLGITSLTGHTYQILTKRPERMLEVVNSLWLSVCQAEATGLLPDRVRGGVLPWPHPYINGPWPLPNLLLGFSAEDQETFDKRWKPAQELALAGWHVWVSLEPLLGPVNLQSAITNLQWVVAGGESGPNARPSHPDWFRGVRDQCQAADMPFFFKQWGEWVGFEDSDRIGKKRAGRLLDGRTWDEFPACGGRPGPQGSITKCLT